MNTSVKPQVNLLISTAALSFFLILISALVRLGTSIYLPALPSMGSELHLSAQQLAFTMTAYLLGFSVASLFLGPLSDHWGRRILIQGGILLFLLGSVLCAIAHSYDFLLAGRVLQAIGGSAVPVATRAMVYEAFGEEKMISVLGWIGTISGLVPALAPVLGGILTQAMGWRANFYLLTTVALVMALLSYRLAPETLPSSKRIPFTMLSSLKSYGAMLRSADFILPLVPAMICFALQGAYFVSSPFIFISLLQMKPAVFGTTSLLLVGALMLGRFLCMAIFKRWGAYLAFMGGNMLVFLGGLLFLFFLLTNQLTAVPLLVASAVFFLGFGALLPISMKAGLAAFPERVGTSSALLGTLTLGATAVGSALVGGLLEKSMRDIYLLGTLTFIAGLLVLIAGAICGRRRV